MTSFGEGSIERLRPFWMAVLEHLDDIDCEPSAAAEISLRFRFDRLAKCGNDPLPPPTKNPPPPLLRRCCLQSIENVGRRHPGQREALV